MSVFDVLDATRLCARWSPADDTVWAMPLAAPVVTTPATLEAPSFSWRALARNPQAMLLTGVVGAGLARDTALRLFDSGRRALAA